MEYCIFGVARQELTIIVCGICSHRSNNKDSVNFQNYYSQKILNSILYSRMYIKMYKHYIHKRNNKQRRNKIHIYIYTVFQICCQYIQINSSAQNTINHYCNHMKIADNIVINPTTMVQLIALSLTAELQ
jgi:hypothetical protein